jgi:hypothetical protein
VFGSEEQSAGNDVGGSLLYGAATSMGSNTPQVGRQLRLQGIATVGRLLYGERWIHSSPLGAAYPRDRLSHVVLKARADGGTPLSAEDCVTSCTDCPVFL